MTTAASNDDSFWTNLMVVRDYTEKLFMDEAQLSKLAAESYRRVEHTRFGALIEARQKSGELEELLVSLHIYYTSRTGEIMNQLAAAESLSQNFDHNTGHSGRFGAGKEIGDIEAGQARSLMALEKDTGVIRQTIIQSLTELNLDAAAPAKPVSRYPGVIDLDSRRPKGPRP